LPIKVDNEEQADVDGVIEEFDIPVVIEERDDEHFSIPVNVVDGDMADQFDSAHYNADAEYNGGPNLKGFARRLVLYFGNWFQYGRAFTVNDIPYGFVTDINYSFFGVDENTGEIYSTDTWADYGNGDVDNPQGNMGLFLAKKAAGKKFSFGISIGGYTLSAPFPIVAANSTKRAAFVSSIVTYIGKFPTLIERIDLDWEYPGSADTLNFGSLLTELRAALDQNYPNVQITAAISASPSKIAELPLDVMKATLQSLNVMSYDFDSSSFGATTSKHHTNLKCTAISPYCIENSVNTLLAAGIPKHKIIIGAATYSRGFANTDGLGQLSSGLVPDAPWAEAGVVDYKDLPLAGATEYWDDDAKAAYSYDPTRRILMSYDTTRSVGEKSRYVMNQGLLGIIGIISFFNVSMVSFWGCRIH
jgi:chitinase